MGSIQEQTYITCPYSGLIFITSSFQSSLRLAMKLHASLLIISLFHILFALDAWKESQENGVDYSLDNAENDYLEEFSGNDIFGESQMNNYAKSMRNNRNEIQKIIPNEMKSKKTVFYQSSHNITPCSCGMEYKVLDLGHLYFPRYIHSMICKDGTCRSPYRCSERYYKVRVLKKKPHERTGRLSSMLPANLRQYWTSETIDVVVGCECIP